MPDSRGHGGEHWDVQKMKGSKSVGYVNVYPGGKMRNSSHLPGSKLPRLPRVHIDRPAPLPTLPPIEPQPAPAPLSPFPTPDPYRCLHLHIGQKTCRFLKNILYIIRGQIFRLVILWVEL